MAGVGVVAGAVLLCHFWANAVQVFVATPRLFGALRSRDTELALFVAALGSIILLFSPNQVPICILAMGGKEKTPCAGR